MSVSTLSGRSPAASYHTTSQPFITAMRCSPCCRCSRPRKPSDFRHSYAARREMSPSHAGCSRCSAPPAFAASNAAALRQLPALLARWLPDGRMEGREWVARNPRRADRHLGSFKVNLRTGRWADFATSDRGGDPVSLAAFLFGLSQGEAARRLAGVLGVA